MRILTLSSTGGGQCGIGDYNDALTAALCAEGHEVDLIALPRLGDRTPIITEFRRRISSYDAAILQTDGWLYGDSPRHRYRNFASAVRAVGNRFAVVILHETLAAIPAVNPTKPRAALSIWRDHIAHTTMINAMNKNNLMMFVHSEHVRHEWIKIGISPKRIRTTVHPVKLADPLIEPRPLDEKTMIQLTIFGFVREYKGYEIALNAMRLLPDNYVLTIAGAKPTHEPNDLTIDAIVGFIKTGRWPYRMEFPPIPAAQRPYSGAERASMESRIRLSGHVSFGQLADIMARTDIALAPYRRSNGSGVLASYIGFGRPTIATALPAFCDLATHTDCFRLVSPDSPSSLAHAIRELAMNLDERRRMFAAARTFAQTHSFAALANYCLSVFGSGGGRSAA